MKKISNKRKDEILISVMLVVMLAGLICLGIGLKRAFAQNIVDFYETDIYTYTTIEHENYTEIKKFDKVAGQYLESSYVGKDYGEE